MKMQKSLILLGIAMLMGGSLFAQEARLVAEQAAVTEGKRLETGSLMYAPQYARAISQLQWNSLVNEPACFYVEGDTLKCFFPATGVTENMLTAEDLNNDLTMRKYHLVEHFPRILAIGNHTLFLECHDNRMIYDYHAKTLIFDASQHAQATNFDVHPQTQQVAYTRDNNLYVTRNRMRFAVSHDENKGIVNGQVVHRNEFGITKGTFWSNSGDKLAYYVMDETMVSQYPLTVYGEDSTYIDNIRYPEAGNLMHRVHIKIFDAQAHTNRILEPYADPSEHYLTSLTWSPDDKELYVTMLDREQRDLKLLCYDVNTGNVKRVVFQESNPVYVEPETGIYFRPRHPDQFVWLSERNGYNHIYLYRTDGECIKAVTPDREAWMVTSFVGFSLDGKLAYFMGTKDSPLQENLYSVDIQTGKITRITKEDGVHSVRMHASGRYFIDTWSSPEMGRCQQVIDAKGKVIKVMQQTKDPLAGYVSPQFRIYTLKAADGLTDLYGRMLLPPDFDPDKKYPVIVYVYGGPHVQLITQSYNWACGTFLRFLAQQGYIVWTVDSRGSANRGFAFESAIHRHVGDNESADQMCGVNFLKTLPYVDADRIGVDGWSYGGFMTLTLKTRYPDVFKVATAGGPVINWAWYEVMYGERYMDRPQDNPEGYEISNLLNRVDSIRGKVMIMQGGVDPVVLPKNAVNFVQKCVQKKIPVDFFIYPEHEHNVRGRERDHLFEKIYNYYQQNL
ncbi:MAG: S9 family peptidase [Bacteroides sp.]|nr:S9 family peptidase [Ruminococcus flavefaciens]MCM1555725.1 S9 family peptidase [Bacteroides sp.]